MNNTLKDSSGNNSFPHPEVLKKFRERRHPVVEEKRIATKTGSQTKPGKQSVVSGLKMALNAKRQKSL